MKSRQKNGRDSRSRETEVGEKIAATNDFVYTVHKVIREKSRGEGSLIEQDTIENVS